MATTKISIPRLPWVACAISVGLFAMHGCGTPSDDADASDTRDVAASDVGDADGASDGASDTNDIIAPDDLTDDLLCEPGSRVCATARTYLVCGEDGQSRHSEQCDEESGCLDGECVAQICEPFEIRACFNETALDVCNFSGTTWTIEDCPPYWTCEGMGCVEPPCLPNSTRCDGLERLLTCDPETGEYVELDQCPRGMGCYEDECLPLCEINRKVRSYVGCEYWSVDLDNLEDAELIEHTVVLTNPSDEIAAQVEVRDRFGVLLPLGDSEVPAGGQLVIRFPNDRGLTEPGVTDWSWTITSTVPVTAHQFNPLDNFTDPFSNDGTLLLPTHALGERYYAMSWVHREITGNPLNGFVTIVATDPDGADVTVRPSSNALVGDGEPTLAAGDERTWSLEQGQTLTLQTAGSSDDLTGTYIESSEGDIAVFGGHECANVPLGVDRCDHIETQLLPIELLRNNYIATKYQPRVTDEGVRPEPDYWRVLAVDGATVIHTDPEIPGVDGAIIASGEWLEITYRTDFILSADRPVMVTHYMVGANYTGIPRDCYDDTGPPTGIGDPAMTQLIPSEQFRSDYIVLTPFAYVEDYLNLAVPTASIGSVRLGGEPISADLFTQIGSGEYSAARIPVEDGPHSVTADVPFGLDAYGYSCHVSYAYPGGLNLELIGSEDD